MVKRKQSSSAEKTTKNAGENCVPCQGNSKGSESTVAGGKCKRPVVENAPVAKVGQKVPTAPTRSSCRVTKRPRRDPSPPQPQPKKQVAKDRNPKRKPKPWALWSNADSNTFFEGLGEYGKDFEAIQGMFLQKHKRGFPVSTDKTKDKIRHFYYRNWHKISKYIDDIEDVNKEVLEFYGLINYGLLRNRFGILVNHKTGRKLNELVHCGSAVFKVKNKNLRLRTPLCRILKKLNKVEDVREEEVRVRIPKRVCVELVPRTNGAWARVHGLAQNPRLRLKLRPDTRISSIIAYLRRKWRPEYISLRESLSMKTADETVREEIYLYAAADNPITAFEMRSAPSHARPDISLNRYRQNVKLSGNVPNRSPPTSKRNPAPAAKSDTPHDMTSPTGSAAAESAFTFSGVLLHNENSRGWPDSVTVETDDAEPTWQTEMDVVDKTTHDSPPATDSPMKSPPPMEVDIEPTPVINSSVVCDFKSASDNATDVLPPAAVVVVTSPTEHLTDNAANIIDDPPPKTPATVGETSPPSGDAPEGGSTACASNAINEKVERFRHGVTHDAATDMTAAELFLMMGGPRKVALEYEWRPVAPSSDPETGLTNMLRRLIHLAATEFCDLVEFESVTTSPPRCCECGAPQTSDSLTGGPASPKTVRPGGRVAGARPARRGRTKNGDGQADGTSMSTTGDIASSSAPSGGDGVFKIPANIPARPSARYCPITVDKQLLQQLQAANNQSDFLLNSTSRRPRRLARGTARPLFVQRTLLPKSQQPASRIMTLAMIPPPVPAPAVPPFQPAHTGSFMPLGAQQKSDDHRTKVGAMPVHDILSTAIAQVGLHAPSENSSDGLTSNPHYVEHPLLSENSCSSKDVDADVASSSYHINELNITLPVSKSDIGEMSLNDTNSFSGLLNSPPEGHTEHKKDIMLTSPSKMFNGLSSLDEQWANSDDFSLSSFLCESPIKRAQGTSSALTTSVCSSGATTLTIPVPLPHSECSRDSLGGRFEGSLETTLQCMLNESSIDYASKFADLAAQLAAQDTHNRHDKPPS